MSLEADSLVGRTIVQVEVPDSPGAGPICALVLDDDRVLVVEILSIEDPADEPLAEEDE
jgi:hypothetical protein